MAVHADTPTNLVVGAGEFYIDHANVGATTDDNTFRIEREIFTPELNGVKGALLGTDYVTRSEGVMEASVPEFNATILSATWPGSILTDEVIDEDNTRRLPSSAYKDYEVHVERLNGGEFQFEVYNAINVGNVEATLGDDSLAAPRLEVRSRWDPADLTRSPHRIRIQAVAS